MIENPYDKGTFKHDFVELFNSRKLGEITDHSFWPEIAEIIMIAGIWGNTDGENSKEQS